MNLKVSVTSYVPAGMASSYQCMKMNENAILLKIPVDLIKIIVIVHSFRTNRV